jgi:hypothetical protein
LWVRAGEHIVGGWRGRAQSYQGLSLAIQRLPLDIDFTVSQEAR